MQYGTIFDYISWRGDITFSQSGFNDIDNLVFSFLSYADFQNIKITKEESENGITVLEYYKRLMETGGFPKNLDLLIHNDEFKVIAESKRFSSVLIKKYIDIIQDEKTNTIQFSAMDFEFLDKHHYIGFRGTDDSIAGWKEDLAMTYKKIPAQDMAVDYLESTIKEGEKYYIGGHSKGGNLAIYGSAKLSDEKYQAIEKIYTNDAPGICEEVMNPDFLKRIDSKTIKIIPTYSMIGMCFPYNFSTRKIVKSNEKGLMQHNIKSWLVYQTELYEAKKLDDECLMIDETIDSYIKDTKLEDREEIISQLFDAFDDNGKKKTVSSVTHGGLKELQRFLIKLSSKDTKTKRTVTRLPFTMMFGKTLMKIRHIRPIDFLLHHMSIPTGVIIVTIGVLLHFLSFSNISYFIGSICIALTLIEVITFFYMLFLSRWRLQSNMLRLYICILLISLSISYFVSPNVMNEFSSLIFGIAMMVWSFSILRQIINQYYKDNTFALVLSVLEMIAMFTTGIYFVIINDYATDIFTSSLGIIFICLGTLRVIEGFVDLISTVYKDHKKQ